MKTLYKIYIIEGGDNYGMRLFPVQHDEIKTELAAEYKIIILMGLKENKGLKFTYLKEFSI